jgi:large subunit ribosomal protein L44e
MQKPIGGYPQRFSSELFILSIYKGAIVFSTRQISDKSGKGIRTCMFSVLQSWKAIVMNVPKEITTYCPKCKKHQAHTVSLYKAGKRRALAKGERHHAREKAGYGGQKYPLQREFAKTTKKQTLRLKCKVCGYMRHKDGIRLRKLAII